MQKQFENFSILYAEDDSEMLNSYSNYLNTLFSHVYKASDGLEAFTLYQKHQPDILLLDISMPKIDGLSLAQKIREHDLYVKIIILTAHADQEKLLTAVKLNLVDYLLKPIKRSVLLSILMQTVKAIQNAKAVNKPIILQNSYVWYDGISELTNAEGKVHLTNKETLLLSFLLSKQYVHYSLENIIDNYYANELIMSKDAVRAIIKRIKSKLPKDSLVNEFGVGYRILTKD